jgi:hypothetical protein
MSPSPSYRYDVSGKNSLFAGDRVAILEFIIMNGPTTVSDILTTVPGLGRRFSKRELTIRLARWDAAAKLNGVVPPLVLEADGLYHLNG